MRRCQLLATLTMLIASSCSNDPRFWGRQDRASQTVTHTVEDSEVTVESEETASTGVDVEAPDLSTQLPGLDQGKPTPIPEMTPSSDPCIRVSAGIVGKYHVGIDKVRRSANILLTDDAESIVLHHGAPDFLILQYASGESLEVGCADTYLVDLGGGEDDISIPGIPFDLTVNGGAGNDQLTVIAGGNAQGHALSINGGPGSDSVTINAGGNHGSLNVNGD